jgi:SNF2 family DNA or RNA helicase
VQYLIPPWSHQLEAIERAKRLPGFALFFEMGTGKTSTTVNILRHKFNEEKKILRTLILCPPIVIDNWRREWLAHSKIPEERLVLLTGTGRERELSLKTYGFEGDGRKVGRIFITNYETLLMPAVFRALQAWGPEALVCDESHKCKDQKAKRTKLTIELADQARYKYILTGTPILNSLLDIFSQFRILDGGKTFGKNFFFFRAEYFYDKNAGFKGKQTYFPDWKVKQGSVEKVNSLIYYQGMRVKKSECLDLPPLVKQTIFCAMTPEQAKAYAEMKRDFITYLDGKACVAELAITKALRLLQIVSGYMKLETGEEKRLQATPKQAALKELLETLAPDHKILVWAVFKENYAQIRAVCEELGLEYVEVHGEITPQAKLKAVDRFNTDPACRVFIGHPGSGGIGINLVSASYSIFYSRSFSLEQDLQAEARNYRGGSEIHERITRIDLVTKGTIDELVVERLAAKQTISEEVLKEWKSRI